MPLRLTRFFTPHEGRREPEYPGDGEGSDDEPLEIPDRRADGGSLRGEEVQSGFGDLSPRRPDQVLTDTLKRSGIGGLAVWHANGCDRAAGDGGAEVTLRRQREDALADRMRGAKMAGTGGSPYVSTTLVDLDRAAQGEQPEIERLAYMVSKEARHAADMGGSGAGSLWKILSRATHVMEADVPFERTEMVQDRLQSLAEGEVLVDTDLRPFVQRIYPNPFYGAFTDDTGEEEAKRIIHDRLMQRRLRSLR